MFFFCFNKIVLSICLTNTTKQLFLLILILDSEEVDAIDDGNDGNGQSDVTKNQTYLISPRLKPMSNSHSSKFWFIIIIDI